MNRLKEMRLEKGWSQAQLGKKLNCTDVTVSRYETGQHGMDDEVIVKLCDIFGCTADYLLGRSSTGGLRLTPEEENIILALRRADDRAIEMVNVALAPFKQEESFSRAASTA